MPDATVDSTSAVEMAELLQGVFQFDANRIAQGLTAGWSHYGATGIGHVLLNQTVRPALSINEMRSALASSNFRDTDVDLAIGFLFGDRMASDRRASEWLVTHGGRVGSYIDHDGRHFDEISSTADLPQSFFLLVAALLLNPTDSTVIEFVNRAATCTQFRDFYVTGSNLTGSVLRDIVRLKSLTRLTIGRFSATEQELSVLSELSELETIGIGDTTVGDEFISAIAGNSNLTSILINACPITDDGLKMLGRVPRLRTIYVNSQQLTNEAIDRLMPISTIKEVDLISSQFTDEIWKRFSGASKIDRLAIRGENKIKGTGTAALANLPELRSLSLNGLRLDDNSLGEVSRISNLNRLELSRTPITDKGLIQLKPLANLTSLSVQETEITSKGVAALQKALPNCQIATSLR